MADEMNNLTTLDEHGRVTLSENVVNIYNNIKDKANEAETMMSDFRKALLKAMIENHIASVKIGKLTCSQVIPHDTVYFNAESFMLNEHEDLVAAFTTVSTTETFDIEKFKAENPELYKKYTISKDIPNVDSAKLEKALPDVYKKYTTTIINDKPIKLMIKESKK